jgi:hypothetical protein
MTENLITQAEIEAYAPDLDLSQYSAATISGMISRASAKVISYCNVKGFFKAAEVSERDRVLINPQGELVISFRRRPVVAADISAIRLRSSGINQTLTLQQGGESVFLIPDPGTYLIYPSSYVIAMGRGLLTLKASDLMYEMDYTGGYATDIADLPPDLKEATTLYIRSMLGKKFNPAGASGFSQGSVSMSFSGNKGGKDQNVQEAEAILSAGNFVRRVI